VGFYESLPYIIGVGATVGIAMKALKVAATFSRARNIMNGATWLKYIELGLPSSDEFYYLLTQNPAELFNIGKAASVMTGTALLAGSQSLKISENLSDYIFQRLDRYVGEKKDLWISKLAPFYWNQYRRLTEREILNGTDPKFGRDFGRFTIRTDQRIWEFAKRLSELFPEDPKLREKKRVFAQDPFFITYDQNLNAIKHDISNECPTCEEINIIEPSFIHPQFGRIR